MLRSFNRKRFADSVLSCQILASLTTYTISGFVGDGVDPVEGVLVTLGAVSDTTGVDGTYTLTVDAGASGDLTFVKTGYHFAPSTIVITAISGNLTGKDTTGIAVVFDFNAAKITGKNDADTISLWSDAAGGAISAAPTAGKEPIYKTNIINGKPVIRFASASTQELHTAAVNLSGTNNMTLFLVMAPVITAGLQIVVEFSDNYGGHAGTFVFYKTSTVLDGKSHGNVGNIGAHPAGALAITPRVYTLEIDYALTTKEISVYANGNIGDNGDNNNNTGNMGNYPFYIGARGGSSYYSDVDIAQIILCNTKLSESNRILMEQDLGTFWGLDMTQTVASLPTPLYGYVRENTYINGKVYVSHGVKSPTFYANTYEYDISTNKWATKAAASYPRDGNQGWVYNGKYYVIGGRDTLTTPSGLTYVEMYDPVGDTWTDKEPIPIGCADGGMCGFDDGGTYKIFLIAGYGVNTASIKNTQIYYPATDTWEGGALADVPNAHVSPACVYFNGYIYLFGGIGSSSNVDRYTVATNTWTAMTAMPAALRGNYSMMAVVDTDLGVIHVFNSTNNHYVYDPVADTYSARTGGPALAWRNISYYNGIIYAMGGQPPGVTISGTSQSCGRYIIATDTWLEY